MGLQPFLAASLCKYFFLSQLKNCRGDIPNRRVGGGNTSPSARVLGFARIMPLQTFAV